MVIVTAAPYSMLPIFTTCIVFCLLVSIQFIQYVILAVLTILSDLTVWALLCNSQNAFMVTQKRNV